MTTSPNVHMASQRGTSSKNRLATKEPPLGPHRLIRAPDRCGRCNATWPALRISRGYASCVACGWDSYWS